MTAESWPSGCTTATRRNTLDWLRNTRNSESAQSPPHQAKWKARKTLQKKAGPSKIDHTNTVDAHSHGKISERSRHAQPQQTTNNLPDHGHKKKIENCCLFTVAVGCKGVTKSPWHVAEKKIV
jgi:hypothetical protein